MAQLFDRAVRVIVAESTGAGQAGARTLTIEKLRVQFKIKKTSKKEPNSCSMVIYNLSKDSRSKISKNVKLVVEAGYTDTVSQIFSGDALTVDHVHDGPNWITTIQCNDGERAYRFTTVSESFKAPVSFGDVFEKVARATGLDVADAVSFIRGQIKDQFTRGYAAHGSAFKELDRLLKGRPFDYSIQDGKLQILGAGAHTQESAIVLSRSTGLVGSPAHGTGEATTEKARAEKAAIVKAKSLLQPGIRPGRRLRIESLSITGDYVGRTVEHTGDTAGGDWYSEAEALPITS